MMRFLAFAIIVILAMLAVWMPEHRAQNDGAPLVNAAYPLEHRVVIPWVLNTRCTINSSNLPERDPEHIV